jgi:hypothetical protein
MTDLLPGYDEWLYAQAEEHMRKRIDYHPEDDEREYYAILNHEIQRIRDIRAEEDRG